MEILGEKQTFANFREAYHLITTINPKQDKKKSRQNLILP
jgi:hypothetical protein